jgi:hypothetical protein
VCPYSTEDARDKTRNEQASAVRVRSSALSIRIGKTEYIEYGGAPAPTANGLLTPLRSLNTC